MMSQLEACLLPLVVILPLAAGVLALVLGRFWMRAGRFLGELGPLLSLIAVLALAYMGAGGTSWAGGWSPVNELGSGKGGVLFSEIGGIALCLDSLSLLVLGLVGVLAALVAIYSGGFMQGQVGETRYYGLLLLMLAGINGCVLSADFFNFFVFLEVASIAAYGLVAFKTEGEGLQAAFKYLVLGTLGALLLLFGIGLIWGSTGALNFGQVALKLRAAGGIGGKPVMLLAVALIITGLCIKAAIFPFHSWLPDSAPAAPGPAGTIICGVLVKVVGGYAVARLLLGVFDAYRVQSLVWLIVTLGACSMLVGGLLAAGQWDLKRLLAYHGVGQIGLVFLALGLAMACMFNLRQSAAVHNRISSLRLELTGPRGRINAVRSARAEMQKLRAEGKLTEKIRADLELEVGRFAPEGEAVLARNISLAGAYLDRLEARKRQLNVMPVSVRKLAIALLLLGAIFHLVNQAAFKSLLMLCAGAIERATGTRNLRELGGLWHRMPVTSATCAIGALAASGAPPFNGFWSVLMIVGGAALAGYYVLAALAVVACFLGVVCFARLQKYALFGPMSARVLRGTREAPASMCFSMIVLSAGCVLLGLLAVWLAPEVIGPAVDVLRGGSGAWVGLLKPLGIG